MEFISASVAGHRTLVACPGEKSATGIVTFIVKYAVLRGRPAMCGRCMYNI
jgi:hypothetical protein